MDADLIEYGLSTTVLGTGWKAAMFPFDGWPPEKVKLWWKRTDYGWRCTRCPRAAMVLLPTLTKAKTEAEKHAIAHPGITVKEI